MAQDGGDKGCASLAKSERPQPEVGRAATPSRFTPGPWSIEPQVDKGAWIAGPSGEWSALACGNTNERARANARLIATAPDGYKLAALITRLAHTEELSTHVEFSFEPYDAALILSLAEALLARAEGRPQ